MNNEHSNSGPGGGESDRGDGKDNSFDIKVNGRTRTVTEKKLSYREVAFLAYPDADFDRYKYTITYLHGVDSAEGDLVEGEKVKVTDGMVFNVRRSDKS